jgi:hypothetical protein
LSRTGPPRTAYGAQGWNRTSDTRIFSQNFNNNNQYDSKEYSVKPTIKDQPLNRSLSNLLEYSLQEKAAPTGHRSGWNKTSNAINSYQNAGSTATEFDLIRLDRVLCRLADEVADEVQACGFSERDAVQAAYAALNAATDWLLAVADRLERGACA